MAFLLRLGRHAFVRLQSVLEAIANHFDTSPELDPTPIPAYEPNKLFALIIGINEYAAVEAGHSSFRALQGAVADADRINEFLTGDLKVPHENIVRLKNDEATADAIKKGILAFASNPKIQNGDPILIYYAGHGAEADIPENWKIYGEKATRKVQLLLPYDFSPEATNSPKGQGIVDRTLSALLHNVAAAKGNNILVILDSCHSASGTRGSDELQRGHELPPDYRIYDKLDTSDRELISDCLAVESKSATRGAVIPEYLANANMRSHVLLAACEEKQTAGERDGRGHFTTTLLDFLRNVDIHKTTYMNTVLHLPQLPNGQKPRCEGVNQNRYFFRSIVPSRTMVYPLALAENGLLSIEAGESAGIAKSMEMTIHAEPAAVPILDRAEVIESTMFSAKLRLLSGNKVTNSRKFEQYRFARRGHRNHSVKIFVDRASSATLKLDNGKSGLEPLFDALFVDKVEQCNISLVRTRKSAGFKFHDDIFKVYELTDTRTTSAAIEPSVNPEALHRLLEAACYFYAHLHSKSGPDSIKTASGATIAAAPGRQAQLALKFEIEFHQVVADFGEDLDLAYNPVDEVNLYRKEKEVIEITANKVGPDGNDAVYGLKITNGTSYGVYMWVFFFNCRALSISEWYRPAAKNAPCLNPKTGFIEIGRGACINGAYAFTLDKGETRDVGFFKIFFSTKYVDLSSVAQPSPFTDAGGTREPLKVTPTIDFWGSRIIPVIQTIATDI